MPLGRPWNDLATTVYLRTFMDDSIEAAGWEPFDSARSALIIWDILDDVLIPKHLDLPS